MNSSAAGDQMQPIGVLLQSSALAIGNLLLQYFAGVVVAYAGLVTSRDVQAFSKLMNLILIPCLSLTSLGKGLNVELMKTQGWVLALIGLCAFWEFFLLSLLLRRLASPQPPFNRLFVIMGALPNVVAIPLAVTATLCEVGTFEAEFDTVGECVETARTYVFMYIMFNSVNIWIFSFNYLTADNGSDVCDDGGIETSEVRMEIQAAESEVPSIELERKPSLPANTDLETRSSTNRVQRRQVFPSMGSLARQLASVTRRPPVAAMLLGLLIGIVRPLQELFFKPDAPLEVVGLAAEALARGAVPTINLMMAFSLGLKLRTLETWRELAGSRRVGIAPRTLAISTIGRIIILPIIHAAILVGILDYLPEGRLFRSVLFIEVAPPTASIVVVLSHIAGLPEMAQLCAFAIVPQYIIATVSLTMMCTFALWITE